MALAAGIAARGINAPSPWDSSSEEGEEYAVESDELASRLRLALERERDLLLATEVAAAEWVGEEALGVLTILLVSGTAFASDVVGWMEGSAFG